MNNPEFIIQCQLIQWLKYQYPDVLFNADCGGVRYGGGLQAILRGKRMKAAGKSKGFPDIFIPETRGGYHGLFIELKTISGHINPEQTRWLTELNNRHYMAKVCYGFDAAQKIITEYLNLKKE
ncbi:MAG: VRR-NUC domain-containing protein [Planctomycetota bacterium]|nr:VRR-NUC domain-containing protein [Planctomycetota bacterium]